MATAQLTEMMKFIFQRFKKQSYYYNIILKDTGGFMNDRPKKKAGN
jgi:hypothetical protein